MKEIYGHSVDDYNDALSRILDFKGDVKISFSILDGWSSINLLGYANQIPSFIVKLPKSTESEKLDRLYRVHEELHQEEICPRPLYYGPLFDNRFSVLILEYIEGRIYESPFEISAHDMGLLRGVLEKLAETNPQSVSSYTSFREHFESIITPTEQNLAEHGVNLTTRYRPLFEQYLKIVDDIRKRMPSAEWNPVTIHGDLYERNVVFQDDKSILLDLEECCKSHFCYDHVYLYSQSYRKGQSSMKHLAGEFSCSRNEWEILEILALTSVITWSIQRILDLELGFIEQPLTNIISEDLVQDYVKEKMGSLCVILSEESL